MANESYRNATPEQDEQAERLVDMQGISYADAYERLGIDAHKALPLSSLLALTAPDAAAHEDAIREHGRPDDIPGLIW